MKKKDFGIEEKEFLKEIIHLGIIEYKSDKFSDIGKKVITKLKFDISKLTPKEKQIVSSFTMNWINKHENELDELQNKFFNKNPLNYLNVGEIERKLMTKLDLINSIREKINAEKVYMSYKNIFSKIERMKNLNDIYLSTSDGKPYKIAFVDYSKNEYLKWEFNDFERTLFFKTNKIGLTETKKLFKTELKKSEALKVFENYKKKTNEMQFCEEILK